MKKEFLRRDFSRGAMLMILIMGLRFVVEVFTDNYVSIAISNMSDNNMMVVWYYIAKAMTMGLIALVIGPFVKTSCRQMLKIGIMGNLAFFVSFILMNSSVISLLLTGVLEGASTILFYIPIQVLDTIEVFPQEMNLYTARKNTISKLCALILPTLLGGIISGGSYFVVGMCMLAVSMLQVFVVSKLKNDKANTNRASYGFRKFIKNCPQQQLKLFALMSIFKGITLVGAQQHLVNLLIYYRLQSELSLGIVLSVISAIGIIVSMLFGRKASERNYKKLLVVCTVIQMASTCWLLFNANLGSILAIKLCFSTTTTVVSLVGENCMYRMYFNSKEQTTENVIFSELCINTGRVISWVITGVSLIIGHGDSFVIAIIVMNIVFVAMVLTISSLVKKLF